MAARQEQDIDQLISAAEARGAPEDIEALAMACSRNPMSAYRLAERDRNLFANLQASKAVLGEAKEALEARDKSVTYIAAYIGEGSTLPTGERTAIVDRGGQRIEAPLAPGLSIEMIREKPAIRISQEGEVVGYLDDYRAPAEMARVIEAENDRLLVELHGEEKMEVDVQYRLRGHFRAGDHALIDLRHMQATGRQPSSENASEWMMEIPRERMSDVGGLEEQKRKIEVRLLLPRLQPKIAKALKLPKIHRVLFVGSTGVGKTHFAKAFVGDLCERGIDAVFFGFTAASTKSVWYGGSARNWKSIFRAARQHAADGKAAVIYVDEIDSVLESRGSGDSGYGSRADLDTTNQLLSEMDGLTPEAGSGSRDYLNDPDGSQGQLYLIGSSNRDFALDSAAISRFQMVLDFPRPDAEAAAKILRVHLDEDVAMECHIDDMIEQATDFIFNAPSSVLLKAFLRDGRETEQVRRAHLINGRLIRDSVAESLYCAAERALYDDAPPSLLVSDLVGAFSDQFTKTVTRITPTNIANYVDLPTCKDGQIARVSLVTSPAASAAGYIE